MQAGPVPLTATRADGRSANQLVALGIAFVAAIGVLDYATGYEAYFAFVYLPPIALISWRLGLRPGLVFAALCAAVWLLANHLAGASYSHPLVYLWNVFSRIFVLTLVAFLVARLRRAIDYERELAARLRQNLAAQRKLNRMLEERLRITDQLAAGVAHEVRNPLGTLLAGTEFLARRERPETERGLLEDMRGAVARAELIVRDLLDFSAPLRLQLAPGALGEAIGQAVREAQSRAQAAEVTILAPELPRLELRMDVPRVIQVLVNLLHNAIDASPRGGAIRIAARVTTAGEIATEELDGEARVVVIDVEDEGPGIPPDRLAQAFEPFYTTKAPGAGTGLGLPVAKRIADDHGGLLWLANRATRGLRATLVLPMGDAA